MNVIALVLLTGLSVGQNIGAWQNVGNSGVVCIHTALLPNSKLLCFARPQIHPYTYNKQTDGADATEIHLYDKDGDVESNWDVKFTARPIESNPFCAGLAQMANGSIITFGGDAQKMYATGEAPDENADVSQLIMTDGRKGRRIYNPCIGTSQCELGDWTTLPEMKKMRWYPTVVMLTDGSFVIFGGSTKNLDFDHLDIINDNSPSYEYWPEKTDGNQWPKNLDILEWAFPHSLYPMAFLMPSERVFLFVSNKTIIIDPKTDDISGVVPDMPVMDHAPWIYPHSPTMNILPMTIKNNWAFVVQVCGGSKNSTKDASPMCWTLNPDDKSPRWTQVDDMPRGRLMPDSVLLPDGKILYVNGAGRGQSGGNQGEIQYAQDPIMVPDLFDPEAPAGQRWTTLASASNYRLYHSGALLLETGHVITTGSEMNNYDDKYKDNKPDTECIPTGKMEYLSMANCRSPFNYNIERFTPPYLQTGRKRPVLTDAPATITVKSTFVVSLSTPAKDVKRVTFIRYSTVTHQTNTDQRFIELRILGINEAKNQLLIQAPDLLSRAPLGNWFLFALDEAGVPSVAKTIQVVKGDATKADETQFKVKPSGNAANEATGTKPMVYLAFLLVCVMAM